MKKTAFVLLIVAIGLRVWFFWLRPAGDEGTAMEPATEVAVHVGKVTRATLRAYVTAYGMIEPEPAGQASRGQRQRGAVRARCRRGGEGRRRSARSQRGRAVRTGQSRGRRSRRLSPRRPWTDRSGCCKSRVRPNDRLAGRRTTARCRARSAGIAARAVAARRHDHAGERQARRSRGPDDGNGARWWISTASWSAPACRARSWPRWSSASR